MARLNDGDAGGTSDDLGGFGEELGGDPAGDADDVGTTRDGGGLARPDLPSGGELGGDPAGDGDRTSDDLGGFGEELGGDPAGDADRTTTDPGSGTSDPPTGRDPTGGVDMSATRTQARSSEERRARNRLVERSEFIDAEDVIFVERNGRTVATVDDPTARLLGSIGFTGQAPTSAESRAAIVSGGLVGESGGGEDLPVVRGGPPLPDDPVGAIVDRISPGPDDTSTGPPRDPTTADPETRLELALERQTGVNLDADDIAVTRKGNEFVGRLTESGRRKVSVDRAEVVAAVDRSPLDETVIEDVARAGAGLGFDIRTGLGDLREDIIASVGAEDEAEAIGTAVSEFKQREAETLDKLSPRNLAAIGAAGVLAPEPVTSVTGGGLVVAAGVAATGALVARGAGAVFPPEIETPEQRTPFFKRDLAVGPSSISLPEVLPPTTDQGNLARGRLTQPELGTPTERPADHLSEIEVPDDPPEAVTPEIPVPTTSPSLVTRQRQRTRQRRRRRRVPGEMLPDEPVTIGGGTGTGIGEAGQERQSGGGAMGITVGRNPRSTELERITTGEGVDVELGPELTRLARSEAGQLESDELAERDLLADAAAADVAGLGSIAGASVGSATRTAVAADLDTLQRTRLGTGQRLTQSTINIGRPVSTGTADALAQAEAELYGRPTGRATGRRGRLRFDLDIEPTRGRKLPGEFDEFEKVFETDVASPLKVLGSGAGGKSKTSSGLPADPDLGDL